MRKRGSLFFIGGDALFSGEADESADSGRRYLKLSLNCLSVSMLE